MITGIDISEQNGSVHLSELDEGDVRFVYVKATEALNSLDRCYADNVREARENGLLTGAYHWLHPRLHVGQQAEFFLSTVDDFSGMLPPMVCLNTHRAPQDEIEKAIAAYLEIIAKATGLKPIIYTSIDYWNRYLGEVEWACDYHLWLDQPGSNWPPQVFPWAGWTFWQFSYQSRLPGVPAFLGLNWFNGSLEELEKMVIQ